MAAFPEDIAAYHDAQSESDKAICLSLFEAISASVPEAEGKVWHGHPVWFIGANPVVGYSRKKNGIELLFWSGQSFEAGGLMPIGKFRAAGHSFGSVIEIDPASVKAWLEQSRSIQWDYANLAKTRTLEKLTDF